MLSKPLSSVELKQLFIESLLNTTDKITKISDNSVLGGTAYGVAKIAQKVYKEIALVEANLFIDSAYGDQLDNIAARQGIAPRFEASVSSTFLRLVGLPGTIYEQGVQVCTGNHGINFEFTEDVVIGEHGYIYAKVRSTSTGLNTNVDALSINKIFPVPTGHQYLINEIKASGGRDIESDELFKKRIKESVNLAATDTLSKLDQIFMKINPDILKVFYQGVNGNGKNILSLTTQNGVNLTEQELSDLTDKVGQFLSISDLAPFGYQSVGIELRNSDWVYIDLDFRCSLQEGVNVDDVRRDIQVRISKYLDWTKWEANTSVQWDNLLAIISATKGLKNVSDQTFYPRTDISVPYTKLPRLRSFVMRDLEGSIIQDISGYLVPVYYQNVSDISFQRTVLSTIE